MTKYFQVYGIRRSGNHFLINWIMANHYGNATFINDIEPNELLIRKKADGNPCFKYKHLRSVDIDGKPNIIVVSLENRSLTENGLKVNRYEKYCKEKYNYIQSKRVLILRDFFNMLASTYKSLSKHGFLKCKRTGGDLINKPNEYYSLWFSYAHRFLLSSHQLDNMVCVNYDKFVKNKIYRNEIAAKIEMNNEELGLDQTPKYGFGSSFEANSKSDFFNRWKEFENDEKFIKLCKDSLPVIKNHYKQIFGETEQYQYFNNL